MKKTKLLILFLRSSIHVQFCQAAFGGEDFSVKDYGVIGDGLAMETDAIQKTIDACHSSGGGTVWVPAGNFQIARSKEIMDDKVNWRMQFNIRNVFGVILSFTTSKKESISETLFGVPAI